MTHGYTQTQQTVDDKQTLASSQLKKIQQISHGRDETTQAETFIFKKRKQGGKEL